MLMSSNGSGERRKPGGGAQMHSCHKGCRATSGMQLSDSTCRSCSADAALHCILQAQPLHICFVPWEESGQQAIWNAIIKPGHVYFAMLVPPAYEQDRLRLPHSIATSRALESLLQLAASPNASTTKLNIDLILIGSCRHALACV